MNSIPENLAGQQKEDFITSELSFYEITQALFDICTQEKENIEKSQDIKHNPSIKSLKDNN